MRSRARVAQSSRSIVEAMLATFTWLPARDHRFRDSQEITTRALGEHSVPAADFAWIDLFMAELPSITIRLPAGIGFKWR